MDADLRIIYHLTPADYFNGLPADQPYRPREFDRDGFIHCTKGEERLLLAADTIYRRVPGDFLLLVIDEGKVTSPVKYENAGGILFPHIYGPLNRDAIMRVAAMGRRADGTFLPIGEPDAAAEHTAATEAWLSQARVEQLLAESADLRARTAERLASIEREVSNLKSQISKPAPRLPTPAPAAPVASAASAMPVASSASVPAPVPTIEARVDRVERSVHQLAARIESLEHEISSLRPPKEGNSQISKQVTKARRRPQAAARKSSTKRK